MSKRNEIKKQLAELGIVVKGNYVKKNDILKVLKVKGNRAEEFRRLTKTDEAELGYRMSDVIETKEPIKIEYKIKDGMMIVTVDGYDYVIIEPVSDPGEVDMDELKEWIEETYYDADYESSHYMPNRFKLVQFEAKDSE